MDTRDFKKFSFVSAKSPGAWMLIMMIVIVGMLVGFPSHSILEPRLTVDPLIFTAAFIALNLLAAVLIDKAAKNFKSNWSLLIILICQVLLVAAVLLFRLSTRISFFDSLVLWTALAYTIWMLMLTGLGFVKFGPKSMLLSFIQPLFMWVLILSSVEIVAQDLLTPVILMGGCILIATSALLFNEHLFSLVFAGMSGMAELSNFLQGIRGEQVALPIGHKIDAKFQYMKFKNDSGEHVLAAPWLHSGPIRSVGGGNLSTKCIELLNDKYADSYFLHIPSAHDYNPAHNVAPMVVAAVGPGEFGELKASSVIKMQVGKFIAKGQRLNDLYLISLSNEDVDDYDINIFATIVKKHADKNLLIIDSHPNFPLKECYDVNAFSPEAEEVELLIDRMLGQMQTMALNKAKMGTAIRFSESYSLFAMIIAQNGEEDLYFIMDTNGMSDSQMKRIASVAKGLGITRTMFFTTDTHALSVKALLETPEIPEKTISAVIEEARSKLSPAKFAYESTQLKGVRVLGETYYELVTMVKILTRVFPVMIAVLFVFLTLLLWIF